MRKRSDGCGRGPRAWGRADGRRAALSTNPLRYRARGQRQKTVTAGGWAELPGELVEKVLEAVAGCWAEGTPGWRLGVLPGVSGGAASLLGRWKAVHDAMVMRLVLRRQTTDEAVGMLVWRFPAVSPPQLVRFHVA